MNEKTLLSVLVVIIISITVIYSIAGSQQVEQQWLDNPQYCEEDTDCIPSICCVVPAINKFHIEQAQQLCSTVDCLDSGVAVDTSCIENTCTRTFNATQTCNDLQGKYNSNDIDTQSTFDSKKKQIANLYPEFTCELKT